MTGAERMAVVLVVKNAEAVLPAALASVPKAAECIVADGGSRDRTRELAAAAGARVVEQDAAIVKEARGNFDLARNAAAGHATRPWILFLDADERLSPALAAELDAWQPADGINGYAIPRVNFYWGRPVRLLGRDEQMRFFRRGAGRYPPGGLHQPLQVDGATGRMRHPLLHDNVRCWADVVRRFRRDLPIEAAHVQRRPSPAAPARALARYFGFYYFRQGAWRDGWRGGAMSAVYAAYHAGILWTARRSRHG